MFSAAFLLTGSSDISLDHILSCLLASIFMLFYSNFLPVLLVHTRAPANVFPESRFSNETSCQSSADEMCIVWVSFWVMFAMDVDCG